MEIINTEDKEIQNINTNQYSIAIAYMKQQAEIINN
jgi:hypothetical protein